MANLKLEAPDPQVCGPNAGVQGVAPVSFSDIRNLAQRTDNLFGSKNVNTSNSRCSPTCIQNVVSSSEQVGIPVLMQDITTPFPIAFPLPAKEVYLRFEFGYVNDYDSYIDDGNLPVLHSMYLSAGAESDVPLTIAAFGGFPPEDSRTAVLSKLIEVEHNKINIYNPDCGKLSDTPVNSAELYCTTAENPCLCPSTLRVAFCVASYDSGNQNGYAGAYGANSAHNWQVGDAICLVPIKNYTYNPEKPANSPNKSWYPFPPDGCCHHPVWPKLDTTGKPETGTITLGSAGGENTLYPLSWFDPKQDGGENFLQTSSNTSAAALYWSFYEGNSRYVQLKACAGGGMNTVRLTRINMWSNKLLRYVTVECITAITVPITVTPKCAIRKRWYDMIYDKLRLIYGYEAYGSNYVQGMSMGYQGEQILAQWDRECSRYLSFGFGWYDSQAASSQHPTVDGAKPWRNFICSQNYTGNSSISCNGKEMGEYNQCNGGVCGTLSSVRDDGCSEIACSEPVKPWRGGTNNELCESGYRTHYYTYSTLLNIIDFIEKYKVPESFGGVQTVSGWDACSLAFEGRSIIYLTFGQVPRPGEISELGCNGAVCGDPYDPSCRATIIASPSSGGTSGTITLKPYAGLDGSAEEIWKSLPVAEGLVYGTFLHKPGQNQTLRIQMDASTLLKEADWFIYGDDEDGGCSKDDPNLGGLPCSEISNCMQNLGGNYGVVLATVYYGPADSSGSLVQLDDSWGYTQDKTSNMELQFNLNFSGTANLCRAYRFVVIVHLTVFYAGGLDSPFQGVYTGFRVGEPGTPNIEYRSNCLSLGRTNVSFSIS